MDIHLSLSAIGPLSIYKEIIQLIFLLYQKAQLKENALFEVPKSNLYELVSNFHLVSQQ